LFRQGQNVGRMQNISAAGCKKGSMKGDNLKCTPLKFIEENLLDERIVKYRLKEL
jgi:hypothetical protein